MLLGDHLDFGQKEIRNVLAQGLVTDPPSPQEGQFWWRSDLNLFSIYDGATVQRFRFMIAITSADIQDGTIVAADISPTANIAMSQLAVNPIARVNHTGTQLAATISDFTTAVRAISIDTLAAPAANFNLNNKKLVSMADGTATTDGATWGQVQALVQGIAFKESVRAASTGNTNVAAPPATIDGVALAAGNRVLLRSQTTASENGIWIWNGAAVPMTRATDADSGTDIEAAAVFVEEGATLANTLWVQTADNVTVGTTAQTWVQFNAAGDLTAGAGLTRTGNSFGVNTDNNTLEINAGNLRIKPLGVTAAQIANATITDAQVAAANKDGAAGTPSMRSLGRTAQTALPGTAVALGANGLWAQFDVNGNLQAVPAPVIGVGAPVGTMHMWGGAAAPPGYLLCDGALYTQATYPDLYAIIGTTFNIGGETAGQFRVPDLRGRVPLGAGTAVGANGATAHAMGTMGGEQTHVLTIAEMPSHRHTLDTEYASTHPNESGSNSDRPQNNWGGTSRGSVALTDYTGGGAAHNIMSPYTTVNFIIQSVAGAAGGGGGGSGSVNKFSGTYGDGATTAINVPHNLGTTDLTSVTVRDIPTGEVIYTKWTVVDNNNITVTLNPAPATNSKRITVSA